MAESRYDEFRDSAVAELEKNIAHPTDGRVGMLYAARASAYAELAKAEAIRQLFEEGTLDVRSA